MLLTARFERGHPLHSQLCSQCSVCCFPESSGSDLQLARELQEEEQLRLKMEESKREAEDFRKLQVIAYHDQSLHLAWTTTPPSSIQLWKKLRPLYI